MHELVSLGLVAFDSLLVQEKKVVVPVHLDVNWQEQSGKLYGAFVLEQLLDGVRVDRK